MPDRSARRPQVRAWVLAFAPVIAVGALAAWVVTSVGGYGSPTAEAPSSAAPTPSRTATTPGPEVSITQVEPIENAPLPEGVGPDLYLGGQDQTLADSTYLGAHGDWYAIGVVSHEGRACLWVLPADAASDQPGHGTCSTVEEFAQNGLTWDQGAWQVTWVPAGVEWTGT